MPALVGALMLSACAAPPIATNYAPSSVMSAAGALSVSDFKYLASEQAKDPIPANVIHNTAIGTVKIDKDVKKYVRDAVFSELRFVGIKVNNPQRVLKGDIEEFLIDDLGYSVDWSLRIRYTVSDGATGKVLYDSVKSTKRRTAKFANAFGALNETVKLCVEELLKDPQFLDVIKEGS
jgi:uncharacterized lipoprotein